MKEHGSLSIKKLWASVAQRHVLLAMMSQKYDMFYDKLFCSLCDGVQKNRLSIYTAPMCRSLWKW